MISATPNRTIFKSSKINNQTDTDAAGGSWDSNFNAEASSRNSDVRGLRINRVGFRIVLRYQR